MDEFDETIKCDISGVAATPVEMEQIDPADDLGLPPGWLAVTVSRRVANPKYTYLLKAKAMTQAGLEAQIPLEVDEAQRDELRQIFAVQVEAQFKALEADPSYAPTLEESDTKIIAPFSRVEGEALDGVADALVNTLGFPRPLIRPKKRKRAAAQG